MFRGPLSKRTHKLCIRLVAGLIVGASGLAALAICQIDKRSSSLSPTHLSIAENELSLGTLHETSKHRHSFHITNTSGLPVTIRRFAVSCGCLRISPPGNVVLNPKETKAFSADLSLAPKGSDLATEDHGQPYSVGFEAVYCIDGKTDLHALWKLNCIVIPTIRIKPAVLALGTQSKRRAKIEGCVNIYASDEIMRIEHEPCDWSVKIEQDHLAPNMFKAVVGYQGARTLRKLCDTIRLAPIGRGGARLPEKELAVTAHLVDDVVSAPIGVHFGPRAQGTSGTEVIRLHSLTDRRFKVKRAAPRGTGLEIAPVQGQPDCYALSLRFGKLDDQKVSADFLVQDMDGTEYAIFVPVRYRGLPTR
jgi:hypothetical protein